MGFICELFRAEQQTASLLGPPFSTAAVEEMLAGRVPRSGILTAHAHADRHPAEPRHRRRDGVWLPRAVTRCA
jgi:hypothetical protein